MPKSASFARGGRFGAVLGASRMFDGLMSRWTMPAACTALSASASSPAMRVTSASVIGPSASRADSDGPSMRSITR
jgi:hypothetical protein